MVAFASHDGCSTREDVPGGPPEHRALHGHPLPDDPQYDVTALVTDDSGGSDDSGASGGFRDSGASGGGEMLEWVRSAPYGGFFGLPAGDTDSDGDPSGGDATDSGNITGTYDVRKDADLDGSISVSDISHANSIASGGGYQTLGRDVLSSTGVQNRTAYAGYRRDRDLGTLYHVRHRVLHTTLGRWLTRDPLGYVDGVNLYGYVGGNPVRSIDPQGTSGGILWDPGPVFINLFRRCDVGAECTYTRNTCRVQIEWTPIDPNCAPLPSEFEACLNAIEEGLCDDLYFGPGPLTPEDFGIWSYERDSCQGPWVAQACDCKQSEDDTPWSHVNRIPVERFHECGGCPGTYTGTVTIRERKHSGSCTRVDVRPGDIERG